ncbi:MAG: hypothetical protein AAGI30_09065 [Planctomycetota bacterium]
MASIGDVNGDGVVDLAVTASGDSDGGFRLGAVWVIFLSSDGTVAGQQKISATSGGLVGPIDSEDFFGGGIVGIGDLDADGIPDIALGAPRDDDGGTNKGAVYLLFLRSDGTVRSEQKISTNLPVFGSSFSSNDFFGSSLALLSDLDNDGDITIAFSVFEGNNSGADIADLCFLELETCLPPTPEISKSPSGILVDRPGQQLSLTVISIGKELLYRWRRDGVELVNGESIVGADADTDTLTLFAGLDDVGLYDVVVTNPAGSVTSDPAILAFRPNCPGDLDGDGDSDADDFIEVLVGFGRTYDENCNTTSPTQP